MSGLTCIVTIHGIGFQQPPLNVPGGPPRAGYADQLHRLLHESDRLPSLGDDPERLPATQGPVYVQRPWEEPENGLARLDPARALVDGPVEDGRIAHVALVYSGLETGGPRLSPALDTLAQAVHGLHDYAHAHGAMHLLASDLLAMAQRGAVPDGPPASSLQPRTDLSGMGHARADRTAAPPAPSAVSDHLRHQLHQLQQAVSDRLVAAELAPAARTNVVSTLERDVAGYVCRNDLRERLRGFVQDVLTSLDAREDVATIVINSHSQGTVLALDVLGRYVPGKLAGLITAGSPLRKYVDLFAWGDRVGLLSEVVTPGFWWNFYDQHDPVADPLEPSKAWHSGQPIPNPPGETLMRLPVRDDELPHGTRNCPVTDIAVDNVAHCRGPLAAHNYWDNTVDFVPQLARIVAGAAPRRGYTGGSTEAVHAS